MAEARFREELRRIVSQKIQVKLVWFVATYTGGRYAIERSQTLHQCFEEVQSHAGEGAQLVTGVAGFSGVFAFFSSASSSSMRFLIAASSLAIAGGICWSAAVSCWLGASLPVCARQEVWAIAMATIANTN